MNELQTFNFNENEVRTLLINNEPYFVGKDVAEVLGYAKARNAIAAHVDEEDKKDAPIQGDLGGKQNMTVINESGLYSLILSSKLPQAKEFKRWVTNEVLPSIRKHGAYMNEQTLEEALTNPDFLIKLATELKDEKEKRKVLQEENKQLKPKAFFADAVATSESSCLVGELAKIIKAHGYDIGQKRLFEWLRANGYLMCKGEAYNQPTQKSMDLGLMEIKKRVIDNPDGSKRVTTTTKITGKGQIYFVNKFCNKDA